MTEHLHNTRFYTFSTISQTLAVAIGLLAAFLVYYLGKLDYIELTAEREQHIAERHPDLLT